MKFITVLSMFLLLGGCSVLPSMEQMFADSANESTQTNLADNEPDSNGVIDVRSHSGVSHSAVLDASSIDEFGSITKPNIMSHATGAYKGMPLTKHVGDYVRNMAQDLVANMEYVTERTPVAVTHFSLIDSDLKETNLLGQQMAESFVHEFHKFRMPVVEFKATQFIRVTETGDFVLSRDFLDLKNDTPIQYVLTGTMTKHQGGFLINARMLGMQSNVIVASAQSFIPFYIVDALLPSGSSRQNEIVDGVRIIRGD
ncbi:FlgO family outer membrane protein [Glaciecola petra]|uniref:FlgO family outer membrane protein n=1 Tax=Glaciecola petra TaxID=3075602 RepID=A0ABU2ZMW1_9ALTE|nr:FlgO family outer membrane protein [Aestuariibacter sp. P117]MDT0593955.1 FlgO family outer membrane protein [Aestuariibacter sp. P117]